MAEVVVGDFAAADSALRVLMRDRSRETASEAGWFLALSLRAQGRWREALAQATTQGPSLQGATSLFEMGRYREAAAAYRAWDAHIVNDPQLPGLYAKQHVWMLTHIATCLAAAGSERRRWLVEPGGQDREAPSPSPR